MIKRVARTLRPELGNLLFAFGCMGVLSACTALTAYLVGPALRAVLGGGGSNRPGLLDSLVPPAMQRTAWFLPAALVSLGLCKGSAYLGQFYAMVQSLGHLPNLLHVDREVLR